jgi:CheY-like chemotaxis protein
MNCPLRVLVVDDRRDAAESTAALCRLWGYIADVAHDGEAALAVAKERRPQAAIVDFQMRGMDGFTLTRRLRALDGMADIPVICVTGFTDGAHRRLSADAAELRLLLTACAERVAAE